ncbi:uncharacterized protein [Nicotiana sylvestris]|uniref:uncharacterized protein n=1 Tax=Nicotiana sylvestris TaxID=4096 RepID=UPI00388CEA32
MMKSLSINVPLAEALEQMLGYAKSMKDLVTKNRSMDCETIKMTHQVSAIIHSIAPKLEDPSAFIIPCTIGSADFAKALCDLAPNSIEVCSFVVTVVIVYDTSAMINVEDPLKAVLLNLDVNDDEGRVECVNDLHGMGSYSYEPRKLSLDLENRKTPPTNPSIEEPPMLELKPLPLYLRKKLKWDSLDFYWDEPYLFKICTDGMIRRAFDTLFAKYGVNHKVSTPYHPKASGQVEVSNKETKSILSKTLVIGKAFHLPVDLEHKAMRALRKLNLEWDVAANLRVEQHNELDEFRFHA